MLMEAAGDAVDDMVCQLVDAKVDLLLAWLGTLCGDRFGIRAGLPSEPESPARAQARMLTNWRSRL